MPTPPEPTNPTHRRLLDVGAELCQTLGYNAFSYRHLAERLGIKTATIHYYFPTKADLGRELMAGYRRTTAVALTALDGEGSSAADKLNRFAEIFVGTFEDGGRLCLCGSFAADYATLPDSIQREVRGYFEDNERWLERVLTEGRGAGELAFEGEPAEVARALFSSLEGAMLAARTFSDAGRLKRAADTWIGTLRPPA
ncbi:MAG: TetR/AcrR family transcriptional regulator [Holophagales bacterium]|nr:TetR/AcrR family transcriptional regulator [Holophagales bacterium]